jgi:hypothetical protein
MAAQFLLDFLRRQVLTRETDEERPSDEHRNKHHCEVEEETP